MSLQTADFDYDLDPELIAQHPLAQRDQSLLMRLNRASGEVSHHTFCQLPDLLGEGDVLVVNDSRVIPAQFVCQRQTGGRIEGLFVRELQPGRWEVLLKGAGKCRLDETLQFEKNLRTRLRLVDNHGQGRWTVHVDPPEPAMDLLETVGTTPLPPYIRRDGEATPADRQRYQTVYAARPGAVAAPTAGMHFTPELLETLRQRGIERAQVTLHVGPGTFAPVKAEEVAKHHMHAEWYELSSETAAQLNQAREQGRRIIAVGTTAVRVLETAAREGLPLQPRADWTDIFLYPPADFAVTDALITNFHLPMSTLVMLVSAFCTPGETGGVAMLKRAYAEAVRRRYRFYSYGDSMLIE